MLTQERNCTLPRVSGSFGVINHWPRIIEKSVIRVGINNHIDLLPKRFQLSFQLTNRFRRDGLVALGIEAEHGCIQLRQIWFDLRVSAVKNDAGADV